MSNTPDIIDEILDSANDEFHSGDFLTPKLIKSSSDKLSTHLNLRIKLRSGDVETRFCNVKLFEYFDGTTLREFIKNYQDSSLESLYVKLGQLTGKLVEFLRTKNHLREQLKTIRLESQWTWQLVTCKQSILKLTDKLYPDATNERRAMIERVVEGFDSIADKLDRFSESVLHGDINGKNVLVKCDPESSSQTQLCILDFQDVQVGQKVVEIAIMLLYSVLEQEKLEFETALKVIPLWIIKGYQKSISANSRLTNDEIALIPHLISLRLCQSLLNGQVASEMNPENGEVLDTNRRGWNLLEILTRCPVSSNHEELVKSWCA